MSNNVAYIAKMQGVKPHPNADRVQLGNTAGYQVVVGLYVKEGDLGIYFPIDTCLGKDYSEANKELLDYFGKNRRVKIQKFRGEISEGFWAPLSTLENMSIDTTDLREGCEVSFIDTMEISKKYVNPRTIRAMVRKGEVGFKKARTIPTFQKHIDTLQYRKEIPNIDPNLPKIFTRKLHGTSQRAGYSQVKRDLSLLERVLLKLGVQVEQYKYDFLVGTRNIILGELLDSGAPGKDGFYSDDFRREAAKPFLGKLKKNEVVYYEVVGYSAPDTPIMGKVKVSDNNLKKRYGDTIIYSYGCRPGEHKVFVYRIAYQYPDGTSIDLTWDKVKERCEEIGVSYVPEMSLEEIQADLNVPEPMDYTHPMEGWVLRTESSSPKFYKEKSYDFKVIEGIAKDTNTLDLEDAS